MRSDPIVLRREAAECRRLLDTGNIETEGVRKLLQDYEHRASEYAEHIEQATTRHQRRRDLAFMMAAEVSRNRRR